MTSIQQNECVQFQNNSTTLLFETNYIRQFANIVLITLLIFDKWPKEGLFFFNHLYLLFYFGIIVNKVDLWLKTFFSFIILYIQFLIQNTN